MDHQHLKYFQYLTRDLRQERAHLHFLLGSRRMHHLHCGGRQRAISGNGKILCNDTLGVFGMLNTISQIPDENGFVAQMA